MSISKRLMAVAVALVATAAFAVSPSSAVGSEDAKPHPKPTIVLTHGAFADGSSWTGVVERLQRRGYNVVAVANPLRGPAFDAAYTKALLDTIKGPIVLVGHSYGGFVNTTAAYHDPDVKALVYIAAFLPDQGETAGGLATKFPGSTLGSTLQEVPLPNGDKDLYVRQDLYPQQFIADVPLSQARALAAAQRPIAASAFDAPSGPPAWQDIPSWSLIPTGDKNIPPAAQWFMANRAHAQTVEVRGASHAVLVSRPDKVTDIILTAAEHVK